VRGISRQSPDFVLSSPVEMSLIPSRPIQRCFKCIASPRRIPVFTTSRQIAASNGIGCGSGLSACEEWFGKYETA
jgi:hypothetical protein